MFNAMSESQFGETRDGHPVDRIQRIGSSIATFATILGLLTLMIPVFRQRLESLPEFIRFHRLSCQWWIHGKTQIYQILIFSM